MLSLSSQGLPTVSVPHSMQNWLCNQAPAPIGRANLIPHSKKSTFSVQFACGLTFTSLHLKVISARTSCVLARQLLPAFEGRALKSVDNEGPQDSSANLQEEAVGIFRRVFLSALVCAVPALSLPALAVTDKKSMGKKSPFNDQRILEQNKRIQALNNAPSDFPGFVREGYNVKLVTTDRYKTCESGLIYLDIQEGHGDYPKNGQQVTFHYIGYNESGRRVDSSYQQGQPAKTRLGIKAMIPGFEEGLRTMKPGGKRRLIVPPELGPPVGPSTFFSAKQFEVFDVELLDAKDCTRRTIGFYSDFVCD